MTTRRISGRIDAALDDTVLAELAAVAEGAGCELVHAEFKAGILRLFLDKPEGVGLADCETVSRQASALLDVMEWGRGRYVLEVSSPGLDRQLYRAKDYLRFTGRRVRVTWVPADGRKQTVSGRLAEYRPGDREGTGGITVVEEPRGERHEIALADVVAARLEIEL